MDLKYNHTHLCTAVQAGDIRRKKRQDLREIVRQAFFRNNVIGFIITLMTLLFIVMASLGNGLLPRRKRLATQYTDSMLVAAIPSHLNKRVQYLALPFRLEQPYRLPN